MPAPGTLKEREEAAVILTVKGIQWLYQHPDETPEEFRAWLMAQQFQDENAEWRGVLRYVAERVSPYIWQEFEALL